MVLTAATAFSRKIDFVFLYLLVFCRKKNILIVTVLIVLSYGVVNDYITNVFNDFSSYLSVFITLEPFAFKKI